MAQLSMADLLNSIKKDDSVVEDSINFPSLQELTSPIAPFRKILSNQSQIEQMPKDIRDDITQRQSSNAENAVQSADFISKMLQPKKPVMLQEGLVPPQMTSQPKMAPEEMEAPVMPAASVSAPTAGVKQAFQATQSPEQKQVAQAVADQQNPLVDTAMKDALAQAQEQADTNQRRKGLFEMMAGIGSLGGKEMSAESESLDNAIKMQNAPVDRINTERDQYKKFLDNNEEMEKADPNSAVSKTMRDALSGMGVKIPANASYSTMEKLAPQLMANQQFKERMADRALQREKMSQDKEMALDTKATDKQNSYLQFATTKTAPIRAAYNKLQNAAKLAENSSNNPAEDITTLYNYVKFLDPDSAVREGEVGLARSIASAQGRLETAFNSITKGDTVDKKTIDNLKKEIQRVAKLQKESYDSEMSSYRIGATNRGIPESRFTEFDPHGKSPESEAKISQARRLVTFTDGSTKQLSEDAIKKIDKADIAKVE